ncbi:septal ring lytic transglycosylase RlpA family protein [Rhodocyclaceae bacterium SMB388]
MMRVKKYSGCDGDDSHGRDVGVTGLRHRLYGACGGQAGGIAIALLLSLVLSACGGKAPRVSDSGPAAVASTAAASGGSSRGGAYYKDDGPHDVVPANLDDIPDATPRIEPLHRPALRPYTVLGQSFVPMTELRPFSQRGHASWYGRRFHGNPTSNGERYDMYAMTAAHPTLPIPSYVRVTHLGNGRSVIVRVNDRGPFLRGRIIDLSYAAAHRLGYINSGSAHVEVETITHRDIEVAMARGVLAVPGLAAGTAIAQAPPVPSGPTQRAPPPRFMQVAALDLGPQPMRPPVASADPAPASVAVPSSVQVIPVAAQEEGAYLQLGAFSTPANAETLVERIRSELAVFADRLQLLDDGGRYRLQLGPFASADHARVEAQRIGTLLELQPFVVVR